MTLSLHLLHRRLRAAHFLLLLWQRSPVRWLSSARPISRSLQQSYHLLQLPADTSCSTAQIRDAYLRLAKLYHPDSGAATADAALFARVEEAYRAVLAHHGKTSMDSTGDEDEEEKSRVTALQHRHYLSYDGVGFGTPSQRERQYRQVRVDRAAEQVLEYRQWEHERAAAADGALAERDVRQRSRKIKITQAVERLVEDLIQESMARGDFTNLSGAGKPLSKFQHNPYADPMTHNLNRILIDNGYQPPWVVTQRDIRDAAARIRHQLLEGRVGLSEPASAHELDQWERLCASLRDDVAKLNKMVDDYNLIAPTLQMQMVHFSLPRETERAERDAQCRRLEVQRQSDDDRRRRLAEKKKANAAAAAANAAAKSRRGDTSFMGWVRSLLRVKG